MYPTTTPAGLDLIPTPTGGFIIRRRWFTLGIIPFVLMVAVWDAIIGIVVIAVFTKPDVPATMVVCMFTHGGAGVVMTYVALAHLYNETDVEITSTSVRVSTKPFRYSEVPTLALASIADIQVRDRTWQHRNDKWIIVCVDRLHKEHRLLTGIDCEYQADYIADAIRKAWKSHEASVRSDARKDER